MAAMACGDRHSSCSATLNASAWTRVSEVYGILTVDRGWSGASFEQWYAETLERLFLGSTPANRPQSGGG